MRGNWNSNDDIKTLLLSMTREEHQRLCSYSFEELWNDLWVARSTGRAINDAREKVKNKFNRIRKKLPPMIESITDVVEETQWGFPKGKKNTDETDVQCALREFNEETRIDCSELDIQDIRPFVEIYKGGNKKLYRTHYFVAECKKKMIPEYTGTPSCIRKKTISDEASDLKWMTVDEIMGCKYIEHRRKKILSSVHNIIS
jgi:8-oxo-dGTP pyrophosphatase MutT (NUDIX family)